MREYELTYLISDDVLEKDLDKVTGKISGIISAEGGKVTKEEIWGRRKLTYPIKKQNFATYVTVWFEIEKDKNVEIEHELRVNLQIIRHLITVKIAKEEELKVTKEDIVGTEEVEDVIGEKSFEVVEGETEASKDLMAVREKEETQESKETETKKEPGAEAKAETEVEKPAEEKKTRKTKIEKAVVEEAPIAEEKIEEEKPKKAPKAKKEVKPKEDEADRIKKLDEKLDELLGDDL